MSDQDKRSFLETLEVVLELPQYMQLEAIKNAISEWRRRSPLVEDVVSGQTTFESTVSALVEENLRIRLLGSSDACNNQHFDTLAKETSKRFERVMPLKGVEHAARTVYVIKLTDRISTSRELAGEAKFHLGFILPVFLVAWLALGLLMDSRFFGYWHWALGFWFGLSLFLTAGRMLIGFPMHLSARRNLARRTLERARWLDAWVSPQTR